MHFIPSDQEPAPELETKNEVLIGSDYTEAARFAVEYYTSTEDAFQILYEYCSSVSNYDEFYAFTSFASNIKSATIDFFSEDSKMTEDIIRLGLDDNVEVIATSDSAYRVINLGTACMKDLVDKYGQ